MQVRFTCPQCGKQLQTEVQPGGKKVLCPGCKSKLMIPEARLGPSTVVGGFLVERKIGAGAMGEVYLATQLSMNRKVALKVLLPEMTENKDHVDRFLHEVRILARIQHANIVTAFDAGEDSGNYYLAMSYVDGDDLDTILKSCKRLPEKKALGVALKVAGALQHVWESHGILHRDIKPSNIMLEKNGDVRLMDMGISKSMREELGRSVEGQIVGTPYYMSPEQASASSALDCRADLYSLGATLYHLVSGVVPFDGENLMEIVMKHVNEPLPSPRERCSQVSKNCAALIMLMMAKNPDERPADWGACIADIKRVMKGQAPRTPVPSGQAAERVMNPKIISMSKLAEQKKPFLLNTYVGGGNDRSAMLLKLGIIAAAALLLLLLFLLRLLAEPDSVDTGMRHDSLPSLSSPSAATVEAEPSVSAPPTDARARQQRLIDASKQLIEGKTELLRNAKEKLLRANPGIRNLEWRELVTGIGMDLYLNGNRQLVDISPLQGLPLTRLDLSHTAVQNIEALKDMPLNHLNLSRTRVLNLGPLKGMPLFELHLAHTAVSSLEPVVQSQIAELNLEGCLELKDLDPLESCSALSRLAAPEEVLRRNFRILKRMESLQYLGISWAEARITEKRDFHRKQIEKR